MDYQEPVKRKAGRPKGSKSTKPRKSTAEYRAEREPKRVPWRPTLYTEDMPQKLYDFYFKPLGTMDMVGTQVIDWPTMVGFCVQEGISLATFQLWCKDHEEFDLMYKVCKDHVCKLRQQAAEARIVDPAFEKFVLSSKFDMSEKTNVTVGQDEEKPFQVKIEIV